MRLLRAQKVRAGVAMNGSDAAPVEKRHKKVRTGALGTDAAAEAENDSSNALAPRFPFARVRLIRVCVPCVHALRWLTGVRTQVKKIIAVDDELGTFRKESAMLVAKAAELFVEFVTQQAQVNAQAAQRKLLRPEDIRTAVAELDVLEFLRVPFEAAGQHQMDPQ